MGPSGGLFQSIALARFPVCVFLKAPVTQALNKSAWILGNPSCFSLDAVDLRFAQRGQLVFLCVCKCAIRPPLQATVFKELQSSLKSSLAILHGASEGATALRIGLQCVNGVCSPRMGSPQNPLVSRHCSLRLIYACESPVFPRRTACEVGD